jgi:hypothetical protein
VVFSLDVPGDNSISHLLVLLLINIRTKLVFVLIYLFKC